MNIDKLVFGKLVRLNKNDREDIMQLQTFTPEDDGKEAFSLAQVLIGVTLEKNDYKELALQVWKSIAREDSRENYAFAQFSIGFVLYKKYDIKGALIAWRNIKLEDDKEHYDSVQLHMGNTLIKSDNVEDIKEAQKCFMNIKDKFPYEAKYMLSICELLLNDRRKIIGTKLIEASTYIANALLLLEVDINNSKNKHLLYAERKLAHYTSTDVVNFLLKSQKPSLFRLNTINNVNDPSEGQLLECCLKDKGQQLFHAPDFDDEYHAFIGCFTFNHDSLNQFRLYGKKDDKEASGVSLVFNKRFFRKIIGPEKVSFISTRNILLLSELEDDDQEIISKEEGMKYPVIPLQPVMRCVYIDPDSGFIHLAQRNEITFYREYDNDNDKDKYEARAEALKNWEEYREYITEKTKLFTKLFDQLKKCYSEVIESISKLERSHQADIKSLLDSILLPLKYLIKHVAFQEEQECRMIYITALDSPEVQIDFGKFLYVDYSATVKHNLDKIYIAPAATQYQPYLAKLLCNTNVKIDLSNNLYRQT